MPWQKSGDTGATYPKVMRTAGYPGADHRTVNEVAGFVWRLSLLSAAHMSDYYVDLGTVAMIGGANTDQMLKFCTRSGLLTKARIDGEIVYKLIDDPEFINIRLAAEILWERQQRKDTSDERLAVPVRARDGDLCRYCGVMVVWLGRTSTRKGTLDHLNPGEPATLDTLVVACKSCNSELRDQAGLERETLRPVPDEPFYSEHTAEWLTKRGRPVAATPRPDNQSEHAAEKTPKESPAATQQPAGPRAEAASDPTSVGHRAEDVLSNADPPGEKNAFQVTEGMSSAGSGRDGSVGVKRSSTANPRSKRSRRGQREVTP